MIKINTKNLQDCLRDYLSPEPISLKFIKEDAPNSYTLKAEYSAIPPRLIKVIRTEKENTCENEIEANNRVSEGKKKNIAKLLKRGDLTIGGNRIPVLEFEFIDGQDLEAILKSVQTLSNEDVKKLINQCSDTIWSMYEKGFVHQDIKPANIMRNTEGDFIILDFGIAKFIDRGYNYKINKIQGPARYLSPEQINLGQSRNSNNQRKITFLSDIYSLGLVVVEMLAKSNFREVYETDDREHILNNLNKYMPNMDLEIKEFLEAALKISVADRMESLNTFWKKKGYSIGNNKSLPVLWYQDVFGINSDVFLNFIGKSSESSNWGSVVTSEKYKNKDGIMRQVNKLKSKNVRVIIDPVTYKLQLLSSYHAFLRGRDYYRTNLVPKDFFSIEFPERFANDVYEFQKYFEPTFYLAPSFLINKHNDDYLEIAFSLHSQMVKLVERDSGDKEVALYLVLSKEIINNENEMEDLLDQLILNPDFELIVIRAELDKPGNHPCKEYGYLKNLCDFIRKLSLSKEVLVMRTDTSVLGLVSNTDASFSINPELSYRKETILSYVTNPRKVIPVKSKDRRHKKYFPQLLNDFDIEREVNRIRYLYKDLKCSCPACLGYTGDPKEHNHKSEHFLHTFTEQVKTLSELDIKDRKKKFSVLLEDAKNHYKKISDEGIALDSDSGQEFLTVWEKVF